MEQIMKWIRERRSVRTFDGAALPEASIQKIQTFLSQIENPYEIPVTFQLLDAARQGLRSPVITGTDCFLGAKVPRVPHAEEAFGYSMELLVLYAQSLGLGTTWIGGTMDRAAFEKAMKLDAETEMMLCVTPLGRPAAKMSLRETMMRKGVKADSRLDDAQLFFSGGFDTPLSPAEAGKLRTPLEAVRLAPSAVNKQPWRLVVTQNAVHFYEAHTKGFISEANGDMQKIDMGIALCHFALAAEAESLRLSFSLEAPDLPTPENTEYIATFQLI